MNFQNPHRSQAQSITTKLFLSSGLLVLLAACSSTLNSEELATKIQEEFVNQTEIAVAAVTCPEDIEIKADDTFDCEIEAEDGSIIIAAVVQKDDEGNVSWNADEGLISLTSLEANIQQQVQEQLEVEVTANCGGKFKIAYQDETFQCQITDPQGSSKNVDVSVKDNQGNVSWKVSS